MSLLAQLNDELTALLQICLPRTCTIFPLQLQQRFAIGSGWMFSSEHIVTNHHVVAGSAREIMIRTFNDGEIRANVVGSDSFADLAVLSVPKMSVESFVIRDIPPRVGEVCLAIGTPMMVNLQNSVSLGVISGVGRQISMANGRHEETIQTDAIINGGNSGGPLIDIQGQVIGVNFAGTNSAAGVSGISYAIPTEIVRDVVPEIVKYGSVQRASIGASITARSRKTSNGFISAIEISKVSRSDSPLKVGDFITKVNGTSIRRRYDLIRILNRSVIDKCLDLEIERAGKVSNIEVQAFAKPAT